MKITRVPGRPGAIATVVLALLGLTAPPATATDHAATTTGTETRPATGTVHHVDCDATEAGDGSLSAPYRSLDAVNDVTLHPGDSVRFKRGSTCRGEFAPQGSGEPDAPIVVEPYGDGTARPVIDADGATNAVLLDGTSFLHLTGLELTAPGDGSTVRRGVHVYGEDAGTIRGIVIRDLDIHDVRGQLPAVVDPDDDASFYGKGPDASGGIIVEAQGTDVPTAFADLVIEGNHLRDVDREGIYTWTNWCKRDLLTNWRDTLCFGDWFPSSDVLLRGNELESIGGDGLVLKGVAGGEITGNTLEGFNMRAESYNAGIWTANSDDVVIRRNVASGGKGTLDSQAFDIDHATRRVKVEQNVSRDNDGGFLLVCPTSTGNEDWVVRNNISIDDGARTFQHGCGGPMRRGVIENNTVYIGADRAPTVWWGTTSVDVTIRNNIFVKEGPGDVGFEVPEGITVDHNLLAGIEAPPSATATLPGPAGLLAGGAQDPAAYRLTAASPALGAGTATGYTGPDFFGTPTPTENPNVGAYQGPGVEPAVAGARG